MIRPKNTVGEGVGGVGEHLQQYSKLNPCARATRARSRAPPDFRACLLGRARARMGKEKMFKDDDVPAYETSELHMYKDPRPARER